MATTKERTPSMTTPGPNLDPAAIGARIRRARLEAGMKQEDLAARVGVIARSIQNYENGRIPWRKLNEISDALDRPKEWILYAGGTDSEPTGDVSEILRRLDALQETCDQIRDMVTGSR